jgi:glycosyltransferase involved in cell wall biosynthesis
MDSDAASRNADGQRRRRFERIVLTSVFGDPLDPRTWSGAPKNLADALGRCGVTVTGFHPRLGMAGKMKVAARNIMSGCGRPISGEQLFRSELSRRRLALQVAETVSRSGIGHVVHTGTLDLPAVDRRSSVKHYLYCDHSWALARRFHGEAAMYPPAALDTYERLEQESLAGLDHIFTFGTYVRDHMIAHYGVPPARITAVGSGMGRIAPYAGSKDHDRPALLFVAKHYFGAKGGFLLLEAFRRARVRLPGLKLTVVGDATSRRHVPDDADITFHSNLSWDELQQLYHASTLLVQPMLNDPWGQVYLEAMVSRTPVVGLRRNGLPEILADGRYGILVARPDPDLLAEAILDALARPDRLERMSVEGQAHVLAKYSWDNVASRIAYT